MVETWDESKPAGSRSPTLGDDDIREFKRAMRERLAIDHDFEATESPAFGAALSTIGKHKYCTLVQQDSDKTTLENEMALEVKDVDGNPELHIVPESAGTPMVLTRESGTRLAAQPFNDGDQDIAFPSEGMAAAKFMLGNSNTIAWFHNNAAPPGWKVLTTGGGGILAVRDTTGVSSGTADGSATNKLIDSGATFSTDGVIVGDTAFNITDNTVATVTAVDSETQLTLDADIFVSGEEYIVGKAYVEAGGRQASDGSWSVTAGISVSTEENHNHTGPSHAHSLVGTNVDSHANAGSGVLHITSSATSAGGTGNTGDAGEHDHTLTNNYWRPAASIGRLCQLDTA